MHYGARATGGAGLIYTEMTCPAADARITPGCAGLWSDAQEAAWTRIVGFTHAHSGAKICLQLGHAGRKGATRLMWDGMDQPLPRSGELARSCFPPPLFPTPRPTRSLAKWTAPTWTACVAQFREAARTRANAAASTCWNCTARTATCSPVFFPR